MGRVDRRRFLAAGGGGLAVLLAAPYAVREAYGEPVPVPEGSRSVEAGLASFAAHWDVASPVIAATRFGQFVSDKIFNCRVAEQPRSWVLRLGSAGSALNPGIDPFRHADMVLAEDDWLGLLYGDFTGLAPLANGGLHPARDGANKVALLGILMHVFAHFPAGSNPPDPELLARVLASFAREGIPECEGEISITDELDRTLANPEKALRETVLPPAHAPPLTRRLAEFTADIGYADLPPGTVAAAKEQLLSIIGAIYAGSRMAPSRRFAKAVRGFRDREEATVLGRRCFRTSARHAGMLNSVSAQVLEWEDWTFIAHSGAAIVPTALAAGELGRASGAELITAIVAANEILARTGEVLTDVLHAGNGVPTHQIETPLVAGKLLGLDADRLMDAVGICCTQPQVTSIPAWTADAKGLLTGWPVLAGIESALYARAGVHGRRDILENPLGYCYRVSDIASPTRLERMIDGLGETWRFDAERNELVTKRYPTDGFQLTSVQAVLDIVGRPDFGVPRERMEAEVERVEVRIPWVMAATASMFSGGSKDIYERIRTEPDWSYIALLFDGKFPIAAALAQRRLTFREYLPNAIFDPLVQAMIDRIQLVPDLGVGVLGAVARVELRDGRVFESRQECIADFPVAEKLEIGAEGILTRAQIRAIVRAVERIETFGDVRDFMRIACGSR